MKKYTAIIRVEVFAETEKEAIAKAIGLEDHLKKVDDNNAKLLQLHEHIDRSLETKKIV